MDLEESENDLESINTEALRGFLKKSNKEFAGMAVCKKIEAVNCSKIENNQENIAKDITNK